jgi:tetratricopeptide (TPR) repeat protein
MLLGRMADPRRLSFLLLPLAFGLVASLAPLPCRADESPAANVVAARRHYDKGRAFYEQGAYRDAIAELEAAHALDPSAKDLVFNLGVVHEKLGDLDDALQWLRLYASMNLTPQESDRAESYVRRLEGVKRQRDQDAARRPTTAASASVTPEEPAPPEAPAPAPPAPPPPPPPEPDRRPASRFDALTVTTGAVAAVGLIAGTTLGIKALADQAPSGFVTGRDGSYQDLVNQVDGAHAEAVAADVSFAVAAVAGLAFTYLFWFRSQGSPTVGTTISAVPLQRGAALMLGGTL